MKSAAPLDTHGTEEATEARRPVGCWPRVPCCRPFTSHWTDRVFRRGVVDFLNVRIVAEFRKSRQSL